MVREYKHFFIYYAGPIEIQNGMLVGMDPSGEHIELEQKCRYIANNPSTFVILFIDAPESIKWPNSSPSKTII